MAFLDDAVENAAQRVADQHEGLEPSVFPAIFDSDGVKELVEEFDAGGDPITPEDVAEELDDELLDPDLEVDAEQLVIEFLEFLEQEISTDPAIGNKLLMIYSQRIFEYTTQLQEGQEEILFELKEIVGQTREDKGYSVFQTVEDRFENQLAGEHPKERYDIPFYGRYEEVQQVLDFVESENDVLIVSGAAGVGKTRLVVESSFHLESGYPEWTVYTTDIHAGNIDDGLDEIDFQDEDGVILFIDDARDADQVERLFDIADQRRSQVKVIFTERPLFVGSLEDHASRFALNDVELDLSPLDSESVRELIRDYYGIRKPDALDWIVQVSEGKPLIAHLLAGQLVKGERSGRDPLADSEEVLQWVFEDTERDIRRVAEHRGVGDPHRLESYFRYLAAVGTLDTANDEFVDAFRDALSLDATEEARYREILTETAGLVATSGDRLRVQPDALREHIVYKTFFDESALDFKEEIYDVFSQFIEKEQINNLLVIENRYDCRDAGAIIDEILDTHRSQMDEYSVPDRVRLLRRFELLGAASPSRAIELVEYALTTDPPDETDGSDELSRRVLIAPSDVGNLYLQAVSILSSALLREPVAATDWLVRIALVEELESAVAERVFQQFRQTLEPGFSRDPTRQEEVLDRVGDFLLDSELDVEVRSNLLDAVGATAQEHVHDYSMDPVQTGTLNVRRGPLPRTDAWIDLRLTAVDILCELVEETDEPSLRVEAVKKLLSFCQAQARYYGGQEEVYSREELDRIFEFAIGFVAEADDLDCLSEFHRLVDGISLDGMGFDEEQEQIQDTLEEHGRYQLLVHMSPRERQWDQQDEEIREFVRGLDPDWEQQFERFSDVVAGYEGDSFNRFFRLFAEERPDGGVAFLEDPPSGLEEYRDNVLIGLCVSDPDTGADLVSAYIDEGQYHLACSGLRVLINEDRAFAVSEYERVLEEAAPYSEQLAVSLASVLRGEWEDDQDWVEEMFLTLLHESEVVTNRSLDALLGVLPLFDDELIQDVDDEVFLDVLEFVVDFRNVGRPHELNLVIAEVAARHPTEYVEFCIDRCHRSFTGIDLLSSHIDINTDRMRTSSNFDEAVTQVCNLILDVDEPLPQSYSRLLQTFPVSPVSECLIDRVPDCSEDQLKRVIWYCGLFPLTDTVEDIVLAVMVDGVGDIRRAETIQNEILAMLVSDPMGEVASLSGERRQDELEAVRDWQQDTGLPIGVQNFAREAEQYILEDIERLEQWEEDLP